MFKRLTHLSLIISVAACLAAAVPAMATDEVRRPAGAAGGRGPAVHPAVRERAGL